MLKYSPQSAISRLQNYSLSWFGSWLLILLSFASPPSPATSPGDQLNFSPPDARSNSPPLSVTEKSAIPNCSTMQWANPLPQGNTLNDVTYGNGKFVAVGDYGTILTRLAGGAWTPRASGTTSYLRSVTWGNNKFVAVGAYTILTSPDGVIWTQRSLNVSAYLSDVVWNGTKFVAVGESWSDYDYDWVATVLTSADGISWTRTLVNNTNSFRSVTWGGNQFVAVGYSGIIFTSPNGTNWTARTSGTTNSLYGVTWGGNQFVAVGNSGKILTSSDGVTWTTRTSGTTSSLYGVIWGGNQFVAVGGRTLTSPDGITWTVRTSGTQNWLNAVTWNGQFVAVGGYGTLLTSQNGSTWTVNTMGTTNYLGDVTWGNNQFVAVGDYGTILTSPTGATWTVRNSGTTSSLYDVTWSGSQFVAVGSSGIILTSPGGITWTVRRQGSTTLNAVTWSGTQFVAVGGYSYYVGNNSYSYRNTILTSPDGITWTARTTNTTSPLKGVAWSGSQFVAVGEYYDYSSNNYYYGTILTSPDGIDWTSRTLPANTQLYDVAWGDTQFVAVGAMEDGWNYNNVSLTSPDGVTWTSRTSANYSENVIWTGTQFVTVGYGIQTSADGITWATRTSITGNQLNGAAWGNNRLVMVGSGGNIVTSQCGVSTPATFPLTIRKYGSGQGTVTSLPAGINCGTTCNANFLDGKIVTLAAIPAAGSYFDGFYGSTGCYNWQVVMDDPKTCDAYFYASLVAVTNPASNIFATSATLNGNVTSIGTTASVSFDFGLTTAYGTSVVAGSIYGNNNTVTAIKTGLTCNTTYNYRVKAVSSAGTKYGANQSFKTIVCPMLSLSPASLTFGNQMVGTSSAAKIVTLRNTGTAVAATGINIAVTGNYAKTSTCGATLAVNGNCTIGITFNPTATGTRTGTLTISSNNAASVTANLTGTGYQ